MRANVFGLLRASLALSLALLAGCGGGGSSAPIAPVPANQPPTAHLLAAGAASTGTAVALDGSTSSDPDGDPLGWRWSLTTRPPGSDALIDAATGPHSGFTPDVSGDYGASLTVDDGHGGTSTASVVVRVRRNLQQPSEALAQPERWYSSESLRNADGTPYVGDNPLMVMQGVQVDLNGDGIDDVISYDSYPLDRQITDPPPTIFLSDGTTLRKTAWTGPTLRKPHAVKTLVGDFDGDGRPDVFGLVAIDPPFGAFPDLQDFNHLLWGGAAGFDAVTEFDGFLGFWYAGAAGDIDGDGRTDIVIFNFHKAANGVPSRILWNQGGRSFRDDSTGIGPLEGVDQAELIDIDGDGHLDLVIDAIANGARKLSVLWGDGSGFDPARSSSIALSPQQFVGTINAADLDGDGFKELIVSGVDGSGSYWVRIYRGTNRSSGFADQTARFIDVADIAQRFDHLRLADIDHDGHLDLFSPDRRDNIRWTWDGARFVKR